MYACVYRARRGFLLHTRQRVRVVRVAAGACLFREGVSVPFACSIQRPSWRWLRREGMLWMPRLYPRTQDGQ